MAINRPCRAVQSQALGQAESWQPFGSDGKLAGKRGFEAVLQDQEPSEMREEIQMTHSLVT